MDLIKSNRQENNFMSDRQEKIKQLQEEIDKIQAEETIDNRSKILPFLQKHCVCSYELYATRMKVFCDAVNINELISLIESRQNGGSYHFGCPISDDVEIRFDDGEITIHFKYGGTSNNIIKQTVAECKRIGLKINFDNAIKETNHEINRYNVKLVQILELKKQFDD